MNTSIPLPKSSETDLAKQMSDLCKLNFHLSQNFDAFPINSVLGAGRQFLVTSNSRQRSLRSSSLNG